MSDLVVLASSNASIYSSIVISFFLYGDPGSGAMLWQLVTASLVGATFYIAFAFRKLRFALARMVKPAPESEADTAVEDQ